MEELYYSKILYFKMFFKIAELGSFVKAAGELSVSPTLLTKDIARFEQYLGFKLFDRTTRQVALTTAGEHLYTYMPAIINDLELVYKKARSLQLKENRTISIAGMNTADMDLYMFPYIHQYQKEHQDFVLSVTSDYMLEILSGVSGEEYDIGVIPDFEIPRAEENGLSWQWWAKANSEVIIPTANPLGRKKSVSLEQLKDETFIALGGSHQNEYRKYLQDIFRPYKKNIQFGNTYRNAYTLRDTFYLDESAVIFVDHYFYYAKKQGFRRIPICNHESGAIAIWRPTNRRAVQFMEWFNSNVDV